MRCPKCGKDCDKVIETRVSKDAVSVRRRRLCQACSYRFTTYETIIPAEVYVVKKDGRVEDFKPDKVLFGIRQACWKRQVTDDVIDQMVSNVMNRISEQTNSEGKISSKKIGEDVMDELKEVDEVAYVRFASVYRHFKDAEAFINEIHNLPSQSNDGGETE